MTTLLIPEDEQMIEKLLKGEKVSDELLTFTFCKRVIHAWGYDCFNSLPLDDKVRKIVGEDLYFIYYNVKLKAHIKERNEFLKFGAMDFWNDACKSLENAFGENIEPQWNPDDYYYEEVKKPLDLPFVQFVPNM